MTSCKITGVKACKGGKKPSVLWQTFCKRNGVGDFFCEIFEMPALLG